MTARGVLGALAVAAFTACLPASPAQAATRAPAHLTGPPTGARPPAARQARATAPSRIRRVCRGSTPVLDTPGGIVIGILARGDHVTVLMHAAGRPQWVLVRGPIGIRGWVRQGALC
jgi:hypothetical protein